MSPASELLVLLGDAHTRLGSVHGVYDAFEDGNFGQRAFARRFEHDDDPGGRDLPVSQWRSELWFEWPGRLRKNSSGRRAGEDRVTLTKGEELWEYFPESGVHHVVGGHPRHVFGLDVFDPAFLLATSRLSPIDAIVLAGREAIHARVKPRGGVTDDGYGHIDLIDEIAVDAERGTLLSATWRLDGDEMRRFAFSTISFDERIAPELFAPDVPTEPREWSHDIPPSVAVTLGEAAARASFAVFALPEVPEGWTLGVRYQPGHRKCRELVEIRYARRDALAQIQLSEEAAGRGGSRPVGEGLEVELDGTRVELHSEHVPADVLNDVARKLVRVV